MRHVLFISAMALACASPALAEQATPAPSASAPQPELPAASPKSKEAKLFALGEMAKGLGCRYERADQQHSIAVLCKTRQDFDKAWSSVNNSGLDWLGGGPEAGMRVFIVRAN